MSNVIERLDDGTFRMNGAAVFSCGCGSVVPETRNKLRMAGVPDVPLVMTPANPKVKKYLQQIGLDKLVSSLRKNTHSVLYNPVTGKYIDLLKAPRSSQVYENIFKVARGL